jgi:cysteinyl-tRNA synthetase
MTEAEQANVAALGQYRERFVQAMDDDLNTADAIGVVFELTRAINTALEGRPTKAAAEACRAVFMELIDVIGLLYARKKDDLSEQVEALIAARQAARKEKNFAEADRIRDELKAMGIELMDTPQGVKWKQI